MLRIGDFFVINIFLKERDIYEISFSLSLSTQTTADLCTASFVLKIRSLLMSRDLMDINTSIKSVHEIIHLMSRLCINDERIKYIRSVRKLWMSFKLWFLRFSR